MHSEGVNNYYFFPLQDSYSTDSEVKGILNKYQSNMGNLRNSGSCHDDFSILKGKPLEFCTYLKYSFYDKVITKNFDHEKIEELYSLWKRNYLDAFIFVKDTTNFCWFYQLKREEIKKNQIII